MTPEQTAAIERARARIAGGVAAPQFSPEQQAALQRARSKAQQPTAKKEEYDLGDDITRQLGLTARHAVTGLAGLPNLVGDAANSAINLLSRFGNKAVDTDFWYGKKHEELPMPGAVTQDALTSAGLPQPQGILERLVGVGSSALAGAGGAGALAQGAQSLPQIQPTLKMLSEAPKLQAAGAATGALGVEGAMNAGIENPLALLAIGTMAGMVPGAGLTTGTRLGAGVAQAAKPMFSRGREEIVGEALNRVATNPTLAAQRLAESQQIVPGSRPTVDQVSRDAGLINAKSAVRGLDTKGFLPARESEQNVARQAEFERIARDEDVLAHAEAKRDRTYESHAAPAFKAGSPVGADGTPAVAKIDEILKSKKGVRVIVQQAMGEVRSRLDGLLNSKTHDSTDPANLYEVRKDLADLRDGKYNTEKSDYRLAKGEIQEVIGVLDNVIESGAPGFRDYLDLYRKRSIPLDQLRALQDIRKRAAFPAPDPVSGQAVVSQAKFTNLLRNNLDKGLNLRGKGPGDGKLDTQQLRALDRIAADLDRGAAAGANTMRVQGSDTFKNMSVAAILGRVLGDERGAMVASENQAVRSLARPIAFLYRMPEEATQQLMLEAWLDPKLASRLMQKADRAKIEDIAKELKDRAARQAAASAIYGGE